MASPVLKKALLGADVRYSGDKSPVLILDGISRNTVLLFLKFIYTGETRKATFPLFALESKGVLGGARCYSTLFSLQL